MDKFRPSSFGFVLVTLISESQPRILVDQNCFYTHVLNRGSKYYYILFHWCKHHKQPEGVGFCLHQNELVFKEVGQENGL